ncbi:MAG: hypothetical protein ACTSQY_05850 [Candidatus Odinarchaeia archaeon]
MIKARPLIIDSNFFINGFKDEPAVLNDFKRICELHGYLIYTSLKVFQELNWRIKKELKHKIKVLDIPKQEVKLFVEENKHRFNYFPQSSDLTLILLAKKLESPLLVSSDFKLIETVNMIHDGGLQGIMGSVFLLKLIEEETNIKNKQLLMKIREKIYDEEIRYSIERQKFYDPITRIKLIEKQSLDVMRNIKITEDFNEYEWSTPDVYPLLNMIKELRASYFRYFKELKEEKYSILISELNNIRREIYDTLLLLNWQIEREEHERLIRIITPHLIFLNYMAAISYIYVGTKEAIYEAYRRLESASGILMIGIIPSELYQTLMISLHQLRIIVLILLKKYKDAAFYFSIYGRKCKEWGFEEVYNYSEGIYYALVTLHGKQIIREIDTKKPLLPALRFLLDLVHQFFRLNELEECRMILKQAFILSLKLKDEKYFKEILDDTLLLYYVYKEPAIAFDITEYMEGIVNTLMQQGKIIDYVLNIRDEITNKKVPIMPITNKKSIAHSSLPKDLLDWMTVFKIIEDKKKKKEIRVLCRNWKFQMNISMKFNKEKLDKPIIVGDFIRLGEGYFKIEKSKKDLRRKYNAHMQITPIEDNSKIYIRGCLGYKCIALSHDKFLSLDVSKEEQKLTTKIKRKLGFKKE